MFFIFHLKAHQRLLRNGHKFAQRVIERGN
jgi:hypothetical protein